MSQTTLTDLLPIPPGVTDPNPYQVFGLPSREKDAAKIKAAVKEVYSKLKSTKETADRDVWKQAATLVEEARTILNDPAKRVELDRELKAASASQPTSVPTGTAPIASAPIGNAPTGLPPGSPTANPADPLAGMLPTADPLAGMLPAADPLAGMTPGGSAPQIPGQAPGVAPVGHAAPGTPIQPTATPGYPGVAQPSASQPVLGQPVHPQAIPGAHVQPLPGQPVAPQPGYSVPYPAQAVQPVAQATAAPPAKSNVPVLKTKKSKKRRKKKSSTSRFFFGVTACALAAAVGALGVFALYGPGLSVNEDGEVAVRDLEKEKADRMKGAQSRQINGEIGRRPRKPIDPVMGNLPTDMPAPALTSTGIPKNRFSPPETTGAPATPRTNMSSAANPAMEPVMTPNPEMNPDAAMSVSSGSTSQSMEMTQEQVQATDQAIKRLRDQIRSSDWQKMKGTAESITERMLTDDQRTEAEALYSLADLATYYRGAIQRGLGTLQATQDFEVDSGFRVLVVEVSSNSLTIRYNARNKRYATIDEIPFRLADKLATFALDMSQPDANAAMWTYHAVAPLSNEEHRSESVRQLESLGTSVPDTDCGAVANMIKTLY